MIITANQMYGTHVLCADGHGGRVDDLLFDDRLWQVRSIVVRLDGWLSRRRVLVPPSDIEATDWSAGQLRLRLTRGELQTIPSLASNPPVAVQRKLSELQVIAWESYWSGVLDPISGDPHLRNTRAVTGHRVLGLDAQAGHIDNFVIDEESWQIRYLVIRIGKLPEARRVVLEPRWVDSIVWEDRGVYVHLPRIEIERARAFTAESLAASVAGDS